MVIQSYVPADISQVTCKRLDRVSVVCMCSFISITLAYKYITSNCVRTTYVNVNIAASRPAVNRFVTSLLSAVSPHNHTVTTSTVRFPTSGEKRGIYSAVATVRIIRIGNIAVTNSFCGFRV